ncbi:MAG: diphthine--ammonia ligase [Nitrososphaera sp.]|nr:diphthine--ammonia ligase [Nitrososphaera sp.]
MKLASLYSGGKDSTFSILRAREIGHEVVCLITVHPVADDSPLFHYPNSWVAEYLADAMQLPWIGFDAKGRSKEDEVESLDQAVSRAKSLHSIEGRLFGGISSVYQKQGFERVCARHKLAAVDPLWHSEPVSYMKELVDRGFKIMIVGVSAMGLGKEWLGTTLDGDSLSKLASLSKKYGFNLTFEGGEAETLVTDCPLFYKRLEIRRSNVRWDGQRGIFEIREVALVEK